ncbi:MAG: class I poly(R)-hydroxyalkanoic acid synthase [Pseudomonadota bacterium]
MGDESDKPAVGAAAGGRNMFDEMLRLQRQLGEAALEQLGALPGPAMLPRAAAELAAWPEVAEQIRAMWMPRAKAVPPSDGTERSDKLSADPAGWLELVQGWYQHMPLVDAPTRARLLQDSQQLWQNVLALYGIGAAAGTNVPELPRKDKRFADPLWREQPIFAVMHQAYLLFAEQVETLADNLVLPDPARKDQIRFMLRTLVEALSPANFPATNPVVLERTIETGGQNLVAGMEHLLADLARGQLTHSDTGAFELGRDIAATPGKVVHETQLYQLIQYAPTTDKVLTVPLLIFPPWINRFYILDLKPGNSFVRWAVDQGLSVFMVSWRSADASMADVGWDDYIRAQIDAIEQVRARLEVPAIHTIGYCVAGTTLAATLAVLARRGQQDQVKSATFFTAQVDFEQAGELKNFIDDTQLKLIEGLGQDGYLDGRYMALTFNLLRGSDLIWNTVIRNYLLGEDYRAFDLLHWNGDTTNLPCKWHQAYLKDLYRDNLLVVPDALTGDGTPIDLTRITVPAFIQAGREDHIAPPDSVWRLTRHWRGPWTFLLAGSGHIAGVVNPPAANKYRFWTNSAPVDSLEEYIAGADEHPGSWWQHWVDWLRSHDPSTVAATGKRKPGGRGDRVIEEAPGRYVKTR